MIGPAGFMAAPKADECASAQGDHRWRNWGPNEEHQCEWCGEARPERAADAIQDKAQYKPVGKFLYIGMAYEATSSDDPRGITLYRAADAVETRDAKGGE